MEVTFDDVVRSELNKCHNPHDIAVRTHEMVQRVIDIGWDAKASAETDRECEAMMKCK